MAAVPVQPFGQANIALSCRHLLSFVAADSLNLLLEPLEQGFKVFWMSLEKGSPNLGCEAVLRSSKH